MFSRTFSCLSIVASIGLFAGAVQAHPEPSKANAPSGTAASATTSAPALDAHTKEDIARHEGMAKAHAQAAQCLVSGKAHDVCQKELQTACKGLALGKHCGLRHAH